MGIGMIVVAWPPRTLGQGIFGHRTVGGRHLRGGPAIWAVPPGHHGGAAGRAEPLGHEPISAVLAAVVLWRRPRWPCSSAGSGAARSRPPRRCRRTWASSTQYRDRQHRHNLSRKGSVTGC
ncbi:hypothetical protein QJS66_00035 [Kocuria rhizophila]|nr:hypothetical protein QJS66_00035 [Kocuria rhizophila]